MTASLALAACGDDEDAPTKEEFANAANNVCADLDKAGEQLSRPESVAELQKFADEARKVIDDAVKKLEGLEVPEGADGEKAQQFIDSVRDDSENKIKPAFEELRNAAQSGDQEAIVAAGKRLQELDAETKRTDELAAEIGARGCAN